MQNRGLEIALNVRAIDGASFKWTPSGNLSINRNKIVDLGFDKQVNFSPNISYDVQPFILQKGEPIGRIYGYQEAGIFQNVGEEVNSRVSEEPGRGHGAGPGGHDPLRGPQRRRRD